MNRQILDTLASLHSRLTLLENQIYLAGRDANDIEYKMESLKDLKQAVFSIYEQRQWQGLTFHGLRIGNPQFATQPEVLNSFGPHEPFIIAHVDTTNPTKFPLIYIFSSDRDNPFKYIVRYFPSPEHSSIDKNKPGAKVTMESFKCRTPQEVYEALQSMMFPTE